MLGSKFDPTMLYGTLALCSLFLGQVPDPVGGDDPLDRSLQPRVQPHPGPHPPLGNTSGVESLGFQIASHGNRSLLVARHSDTPCDFCTANVTSYLSHSDGTGLEWTPFEVAPAGTVTRDFGSTIGVGDEWSYFFWSEADAGLNDYELYVTRTRDGAWEPPRHIDKGLPIGVQRIWSWSVHVEPGSALAGTDHVYVCFARGPKNSPSGPRRMFFTGSYDGGETFTPPLRLGAVDHLYRVRDLSASGDRIELFSTDDRDGVQHLRFRASDDAGATWSEEIQLSSARVEEFNARVADGDRRAVIWTERLEGGDRAARYATSLDAGASWTLGTVFPSVDEIDARHYSLIAHRDRLVFAWREEVDGISGAFVASSLDWAETWSPRRRIGRANDPIFFLQLGGGPSLVEVRAYGFERDYGQVSLDGGVRWQSLDRPRFASALYYNELYDAYSFSFGAGELGEVVHVGHVRPLTLRYRLDGGASVHFELTNAGDAELGYVLLSMDTGDAFIGDRNLGLAPDALFALTALTPELFAIPLRDGAGATPALPVLPEFRGMSFQAVGLTFDAQLRVAAVSDVVPASTLPPRVGRPAGTPPSSAGTFELR